MKPLTVREYATLIGITMQGVYKQIKEKRIKSEKKYGVILVYPPRKLKANENQTQPV